MSPHYRETVGGGGGRGEEDPLQGPRPPERLRSSQEQNLMWRAKRLSCRLSQRASVLWGGWGGEEDSPPPPVPRHRTEPSKYEVVVSDRNHLRLLNTRTRSYTCKELLCIVFVPCLLICILGIVCSSLVIHHVLGKEYQDEISTLTADLTSARDQNGVFMSKEKYQALMDQMNRQKRAIDHEKEAVTELSSQLKKKTHELLETSRKLSEVRESLDCTWSLVQKTAGGGRQALLTSLEAECSLSSLARAHLLLAVNDEAVQQRAERKEQSASLKSEPGSASGSGGTGRPGRHRHSHHVSNNDRQHWLLGSNSQVNSDSTEFQQFLATEFTRMEQSIIDFASQQEIFCAEFKRSLDAEVERRHSDLGGVSASLSKMLETQLQTVGKLSNLATNQLYAEQKWVTTYLKNARNEADKESTVMQKFLTENLLILLQQVDASLQDQTKTLESLKQGISIAFNNIIADRNEFLHNQRKMLLTANNKVKAFSQLQISEMRAISEREEKLKRSELQFGERFVEAKKKIDSLLSSLFSEYDSYSSLANKTSEANSRNLASSSSRQEQMTSLIDVALTEATDKSKDFSFKAEKKEKVVRLELVQKISEGIASSKAVTGRLDRVEAQTKQFIGERQGSWELHYNNQEIQLRKKADTNKELLQKHQVESQDLHTQMRTTTNSLESLLESHRQSDNQKTGERQSDLQSQCKIFSSFSEFLSSELHARDSDIANFMFSLENPGPGENLSPR